MSHNETARYTELLPSGKARMFSFEMQAKSLITSPSGNMLLPDKGLYSITGLAWSGRGRIKQVEVSVDGGKRWVAAQLQQPVLPKSFYPVSVSLALALSTSDAAKQGHR